jgi:predicted RNA-binding Zn-ribbon protein involved in translation (DUF1610 family)
MAQGRKGELNYRCPMCFMREIDMDMLHDEQKEEYYCLRCSFTGTENEVLMLNERARYRFKDRAIRITDFSLPRHGILRLDSKVRRYNQPKISIRSTKSVPHKNEPIVSTE